MGLLEVIRVGGSIEIRVRGDTQICVEFFSIDEPLAFEILKKAVSGMVVRESVPPMPDPEHAYQAVLEAIAYPF